jgi:hypothetical protein
MAAPRTRPPWLDSGEDVTIRRAGPGDAGALARLAALDEARPLVGEVLVADVGGALWAAAELAGGRTIADPFRPTLAVRELLALRRGSFVGDVGRRGRLRLLRHRTA